MLLRTKKQLFWLTLLTLLLGATNSLAMCGVAFGLFDEIQIGSITYRFKVNNLKNVIEVEKEFDPDHLLATAYSRLLSESLQAEAPLYQLILMGLKDGRFVPILGETSSGERGFQVVKGKAGELLEQVERTD